LTPVRPSRVGGGPDGANQVNQYMRDPWSPRRRNLVASALALALIVGPTLSSAAYPRPGRTELVSVATDGGPGDKFAGTSSVSGNGRFVAFSSDAADLVEGDVNFSSDIFVRDLMAGTTERISVATGGGESNAPSFSPGISADGRYVAFASLASNLVAADTNDKLDIFVHDRVADTTSRASVGPGGAQANDGSRSAAISGDGRVVAFASSATNLGAADTTLHQKVYVHDLSSGTTEVVSVGMGGAPLTGFSENPSLSFDGRYVSFTSFATNLVAGDTNGRSDAFVFDRVTDTAEIVSVTTAEAASGDHIQTPIISADGQHVAFVTGATNFTPMDTNGRPDVFVRDRDQGTTDIVSVAWDGAAANSFSSAPAISSDGRLITFTSAATNLVPGDTNAQQDVFVHDRASGMTDRVSLASDGAEGTGGGASFPAASSDASVIGFASTATNLVAGDTGGSQDIFVRKRGPITGIGELVATPSGSNAQVQGWATFGGLAVSSASDPETDGAAGAAEAGAEITGAALILRPENEDLLIKIMARDIELSRNAILFGFQMTVDGVPYEVRAMRLAATGVPPSQPYFGLYKCDSGCTQSAILTGGFGATGDELRVALPLNALQAGGHDGASGLRAYTAEGEAVVGPVRAIDEVILPDAVLPAPAVALGIAPAGAPAEAVAFDTPAALDAGTFSGTIDASSLSDGEHEVWARACVGATCGLRAVPFEGIDPSPSPSPSPSASPSPSPSPSPTPEPDPDPKPRPRPRTERISVSTSGGESDELPGDFAMSADGRYVAFTSTAATLVPRDTNREADVFVHDRRTGATRRVSVASDGSQGDGLSSQPAMSADARYIAFVSSSSNFAGGEETIQQNLFLRDRQAGTTELISRAVGGGEPNSFSAWPEMSADGRYIAFSSFATNIVPGDTGGAQDIFVFDRTTGTTERITRGTNDSEANSYSTMSGISDDGRFIAFQSMASNLVLGDNNGTDDIFLYDREANTTRLVSVSSDGTQGDDTSEWPTISADGRYISFSSQAALVPNDTNGAGFSPPQDTFVHDALTGRTERVSVTSEGIESAGSFNYMRSAISDDGRFVTFTSSASDLVPGDTNEMADTFVHDRELRTTQRISVAPDGSQGTGERVWDSGAFHVAIADGGRVVAFDSEASDLVPGDTNELSDAFTRDRGPVNGVGDMTITRTGGELKIEGWSSFAGRVISGGDDPADDGAFGASESGGEIRAARLAYRPGRQDLLVRVELASLPPTTEVPALTTTTYAFGFTLGGTDYEIRSGPGGFALFACGPDECQETAALAGGLGVLGDELAVAVPLHLLAAEEGDQITDARAWTSASDQMSGVERDLDEVSLQDSEIPKRHVAVGIAPSGTPAGEVVFDNAGTMADGSFIATLDDASGPGGFDVWVRGCLGLSGSATSAPFRGPALGLPTSTPITCTPLAPPPPRGTVRSTIATTKSVTGFRRPFTLSGRVSTEGSCGGPLTVEVSRRAHGTSGFLPIREVVAGESGGWELTTSSKVNASYAVRTIGTRKCDGTTSAPIDIQVKASLELSIPTRCRAPQNISGALRPNHAGSRVSLQKKRRGRWVTIDKDMLGVRSRFTVTAPTCGTRYRVRWPRQDLRNLGTALGFVLKRSP
jgi:Tol biopolymer transport system component